MMKPALLRFLPLAASAALAAACGSLDASTDRMPVLATVHGTVLDPQNIVSPRGAIRVAIVWRSSVSTGRGLQVTQDLPVQPIFPASFAIDLDGPPPTDAVSFGSAMSSPPPDASFSSTGSAGSGGGTSGSAGSSSLDGGGLMAQSLRTQGVSTSGSGPFAFAFGTVVAYADTNGNGMLDLLPPDAGSYGDQIIATNVDLSLVYVQGMIPPEARLDGGIGPVDGYNVLSDTPCPLPPEPAVGLLPSAPNPACATASPAPAPTADGGPLLVPVCHPDLKWLPVSTPFVLTPASEPEISSLICANGGPASQPGGASGSGTAPQDPSIQPAQYPDPCDPNLLCAPDGSSYQYDTCTTVYQGICLPSFITCTALGYTRPTPAPASWPCIH